MHPDMPSGFPEKAWPDGELRYASGRERPEA